MPDSETNFLREEQVNIAPESSGAVYRPLHVERRVKIYPIQEHELTTLTTFNNQVTLWCSIGTMAIALMLGCVWDMLNLPKDQAVSLGAKAFVGGCVAVSFISFGLAFQYHSSRQNTLGKILDETSR